MMNWKIIIFIILGVLGIGFLIEWYFLNVMTNLGSIIEVFNFVDWLSKQDNILIICLATIAFVIWVALPEYIKERLFGKKE